MTESELRDNLKRFAARLMNQADDPERDMLTTLAASIEVLRLLQAEYMLAEQKETMRALN